MNPDVKEKWVAALRSGKYKQGRKKLRPTEDTYCCLGVLCDVSGLGTWGSRDDPTIGVPDATDVAQDATYTVEYDTRTGTLPEKVLEHLDASFEFTSGLAGLNDTGSTFSEIADAIEAGVA